jgi:hypothetical protein
VGLVENAEKENMVCRRNAEGKNVENKNVESKNDK